jgi:hypothetical protein
MILWFSCDENDVSKLEADMHVAQNWRMNAQRYSLKGIRRGDQVSITEHSFWDLPKDNKPEKAFVTGENLKLIEEGGGGGGGEPLVELNEAEMVGVGVMGRR